MGITCLHHFARIKWTLHFKPEFTSLKYGAYRSVTIPRYATRVLANNCFLKSLK